MALKYAFIWNYRGETPDQYTFSPLTTILRKITKNLKKKKKSQVLELVIDQLWAETFTPILAR